MPSRRTVVAALAIAPLAAVSLLASDPARAEVGTPFTQEAFAAAQAAGKPILVDVTAPWCPTCKAQKPILSDLTGRPDFADMVVLAVDFDSQKDVVRGLGATMQSTLIVFRGDRETGRSVGETDAAAIETLLRSAL
jgi:thiol:disulfide interchange protein